MFVSSLSVLSAVADLPRVVAQVGINLATPSVDWVALIPHILLAGGALLLLMIVSLAGALSKSDSQSGQVLPSWFASSFTALLGVGTICASAVLWMRIGEDGPTTTLSQLVSIDRFGTFIIGLLGCVVVLVALLSENYVRRERLWGTELYVLLLLSAAGGAIMAGANDLIVMFLGVEVLSIAAYVLAAMHLRRSQSQEAGMKYFVLGAFSSAFLLYGIALIYGATGSTKLPQIQSFLAAGLEKDGLLLGGFALLLVGMFFKVAAVPFHAWTPDVYQGAPTPVVAYMASGVKAAGFAIILRVFVEAFGGYASDWQPMVFAVAVATMFVGGIAAIVQTDVKRMLAYSSISHAGFILVGVQAASEDGVAASLFYLAAYSAIAIGSFAVVSVVATSEDRTSMDTFKGLAGRRPVLSAAFMVLLLAQAGVPLTAGFMAKFTVISAAVEARSFWLAALAMLSAVISAFIYLRLLVTMYLSEPGQASNTTETAPAKATPAKAATSATRVANTNPEATLATTAIPKRETLVIAITTAFTLTFGIIPAPLLNLTQSALLSL